MLNQCKFKCKNLGNTVSSELMEDFGFRNDKIAKLIIDNIHDICAKYPNDPSKYHIKTENKLLPQSQSIVREIKNEKKLENINLRLEKDIIKQNDGSNVQLKEQTHAQLISENNDSSISTNGNTVFITRPKIKFNISELNKKRTGMNVQSNQYCDDMQYMIECFYVPACCLFMIVTACKFHIERESDNINLQEIQPNKRHKVHHFNKGYFNKHLR